ncbi:MAG: helix-turn-helix domain-containing protein [Candidatus Latescibacteria bacterium]|nr:helix-turn-helix domain-containing protein [Candidatus Latescibacterota bacterium]
MALIVLHQRHLTLGKKGRRSHFRKFPFVIGIERPEQKQPVQTRGGYPVRIPRKIECFHQGRGEATEKAESADDPLKQILFIARYPFVHHCYLGGQLLLGHGRKNALAELVVFDGLVQENLAHGRKGGRPKALDEEKRRLAVELYEQGKYPIKQICEMMEISKPTLYAYVRTK